jgi:hypothetical protein
LGGVGRGQSGRRMVRPRCSNAWCDGEGDQRRKTNPELCVQR